MISSSAMPPQVHFCFTGLAIGGGNRELSCAGMVQKPLCTGFLNGHRAPLKKTEENILVYQGGSAPTFRKV